MHQTTTLLTTEVTAIAVDPVVEATVTLSAESLIPARPDAAEEDEKPRQNQVMETIQARIHRRRHRRHQTTLIQQV
jgi:hypothetical protein